MIIFVIISLLTLGAVASPFFLGEGGSLSASAQTQSEETLQALKASILQSFLKDEKLFLDKTLSERTWRERRNYLISRFVDASRRLDFLKNQKISEKGNAL